jgi:hypothetical protein
VLSDTQVKHDLKTRPDPHVVFVRGFLLLQGGLRAAACGRRLGPTATRRPPGTGLILRTRPAMADTREADRLTDSAS